MTEPTDADRTEQALKDVVGRFGSEVGNDGPRLSALLNEVLGPDGSPGSRLYIDALVSTAQIQLSKAMTRGLSASDAAKGLAGTGMSTDMASWVTGAWVKALAVPPFARPVTEPSAGSSEPGVTTSSGKPVTPAPNVNLSVADEESTISGVGSGESDPADYASTPTASTPPAATPDLSADILRSHTASDVEPPLEGTGGDSFSTDLTRPNGPRPVDVMSRDAPAGAGDPRGAGNGNVGGEPSDRKGKPAWLLPVGAVAIIGIAVAAFALIRSGGDSGLTSRATSVVTTESGRDGGTTVAAAADSSTGADTTTAGSDTKVSDTSASIPSDPVPVVTSKVPVTTPAPTIGSASTDVSAAEMVTVPAGSYPVGSPKPDLLAESSRRNVDMPAYFIDLHEVTNSQYKAFVDQTGAAPPLAGWTKQGPPDDQLDHPVRAVTFEWATAYCTSLGKRLPTEAEWEIAAGGTDGTKYAWGNDVATVQLPANGSYPVMSVAANKSSMGVFDMTGSVWEWVGDSYDTNKVGTGKHVLRGGQNGYVRNNWSRLPVDEKASNAVLAAGVRCAATSASVGASADKFSKYTRPADPVAPAVTVPAGFKSFDDFSGAKLEWVEINKPYARFGYHPNKFFHLETKEKSTNIVALCPCVTPGAPIGVLATGEVESSLTQPEGTFEWGIVIRSDESTSPPDPPPSYVALVVDPRNHRWRAYVHRSDGTTTDIGRAQFNSDETENIKLELRDMGNKIEYYINDTYRGESPPGAVLPSGNHAGFVLTSDAASTKVHIHFGSFGIRSVS